MFGPLFRILRLSHLLHHKLNRTPIEATELYDKEKTSVLVAVFGYYFQILGGLYLVEFLSPLLFFLPRSSLRRFKDRFVKADGGSGILMQNWTQDAAVREIRIDALFIFTWSGLSLLCYRPCRRLLLSFLVSRGLFLP